MKAYFLQKEYVIEHNFPISIKSKVSKFIDKDLENKIDDNAKSFFSKENFFNIDDKLIKLSYQKIDNYYVINIVEFRGLDIFNNQKYILNSYVFSTPIINPFSIIFSLDNLLSNESDISFNFDDNINYNEQLKLDSNTLISLISNIVNNKDLNVRINPLNIKELFYILSITLPKEYIEDITYSFGTLKDVKLNIKEEKIDSSCDFIENNPLNYKNNYGVYTVKYLFDDINYLDVYKNEILNLKEKINVNYEILTNIYCLIHGNIKDLNITSINSSLEYLDDTFDNNFISTSLFLRLKYMKVEYNLLNILSYIFKYNNESHKYIIELFFNNLNTFGIDVNSNTLEFLSILKANVPFNLRYVLDIIDIDAKINDLYSNINLDMVLLNSILENIKSKRISLVPNLYLDKFITKAIEKKDLELLDIVLNEIGLYNTKAKSRLLFLSLEELEKKNKLLNYDIEFILQLIVRIDVIDSVIIFKKLFNKVQDRYSFVRSVIKFEQYHQEYFLEFNQKIKDLSDYKEYFLIKNNLDIYMKKIEDISDLDYIYNSSLDVSNTNKSIFIEKVKEFLESTPKDKRVDLAFEIYDKYYKNSTKRNISDDLRILSKIIYSNAEALYLNDVKYYNDLVLINQSLEKVKIKAPLTFETLELGLKFKKLFINEDYRVNNLLDIINNKINKLTNEQKNDIVKYYYIYLLDTVFSYVLVDDSLMYMKIYYNMIKEFIDIEGFRKSLIDSLSNLNISDLKSVYFMLLTALIDKEDKYIKLLKYVIHNYNLRKYIVLYVKALDMFEREIKEKTIKFINEYIETFNVFYKIYYKIKLRKYLKV